MISKSHSHQKFTTTNNLESIKTNPNLHKTMFDQVTDSNQVTIK